MTAWKVMLTDGLEDCGQEILRKNAQLLDRNGISADDLLKEIPEADALIVRGRTKVTSAVFEAATNLKVVGRAGVGVDNIDLAAAKAKGVTVVNSPTATTLAVAELAFGLMLAMVREIPRADSGMKANQWLKKELKGSELRGKTLGIIGMGRIGGTVAEFAKAFGMKVITRFPTVQKDHDDPSIEKVSQDELFARADIISLHLPLKPETKNLINRETIAKMKPGVKIVSVARGGIINEEDLLEALKSGKVSAAALDVFAVEPPGENPLVNHPKVLCTPHIGAQTNEAQDRAAEDISTEVLAALDGKELRWRVA